MRPACLVVVKGGGGGRRCLGFFIYFLFGSQNKNNKPIMVVFN